MHMFIPTDPIPMPTLAPWLVPDVPLPSAGAVVLEGTPWPTPVSVAKGSVLLPITIGTLVIIRVGAAMTLPPDTTTSALCVDVTRDTSVVVGRPVPPWPVSVGVARVGGVVDVLTDVEDIDEVVDSTLVGPVRSGFSTGGGRGATDAGGGTLEELVVATTAEDVVLVVITELGGGGGCTVCVGGGAGDDDGKKLDFEGLSGLFGELGESGLDGGLSAAFSTGFTARPGSLSEIPPAAGLAATGSAKVGTGAEATVLVGAVVLVWAGCEAATLVRENFLGDPGDPGDPGEPGDAGEPGLRRAWELPFLAEEEPRLPNRRPAGLPGDAGEFGEFG